MIEVELLAAQYGDAIWIRYGKDEDHLHHVLIDTGFRPTAEGILGRLQEDRNIQLDLFVLTHIDADHIEGSIFLLQDKKVATPARINDVWFNGWVHIDAVAKDAMGALQGEYFSALIKERGLPWNKAFGGKAVMVPDEGPLPTKKLPGGMRLTLLSPSVKKLKALRSYWVKDLDGRLKPGDEEAALELLSEDSKYVPDALGGQPNVPTLVARAFKEDPAKANGSSIAFLADYDGKRMLFTGDAHPSVLLDSLDRVPGAGNPIRLDIFKLAHHGSAHNTSPELVQRVDCANALISTNGAKFKHPDAECVARLVDRHRNRHLELHFNYSSKFNDGWNDTELKRKYGYEVDYGVGGALAVRL